MMNAADLRRRAEAVRSKKMITAVAIMPDEAEHIASVFDAAARALDVMQRLSPDYCAANEVEQTTDAEFDEIMIAMKELLR